MSGKKRCKRWVREIVERMLHVANVEVTLLPTKHAGHMVELAPARDLDTAAVRSSPSAATARLGAWPRASCGAPPGNDVALGVISGGTGNMFCYDVYGGRISGDAGSVRLAVEGILAGCT